MAEYTQVKTFEELCNQGARYVSDESSDHPNWIKTGKGCKTLYELTGDKAWIAPLIQKYNKLGFYTVISQPGDVHEAKIFKSHTDFMNYASEKWQLRAEFFKQLRKEVNDELEKKIEVNNQKEDNRDNVLLNNFLDELKTSSDDEFMNLLQINKDDAEKTLQDLIQEYIIKDTLLTDAKYTHGQRASISGYMMRNMAERVYNELKDNQHLIVRISCKDEPVPEEYHIMSLSFKDGQPMFEELKEHNRVGKELNLNKCFDNDENFKKLNHVPTSYFTRGIHDPKSFSYFKKDFVNLDPKLFEDDVVVRFEIMDKRWNDNSLLWSALMTAIEKHTIMTK
jgi:hypothetical protein